ncbi:MAG: hypothetical protein ACLFSF_06395 [Desulfonatronovibrio sp.]
MTGKIFIRERRKIEKGEKKPRFRVVATSGTDLKFKVDHIRKQEVEEIASLVGAEVVLLKPEKGKTRNHEDEEI